MPFAKVIDLCQVGLLLLCFHVYHWVTFLPKIPTQKFLFFLNQLSTFLKHVFRWFSDNFIHVFSSYSPSITFFLPFPLILFLPLPTRSLLVSCLCMDVCLCLCLYVCLCLRVSVHAGVTKTVQRGLSVWVWLGGLLTGACLGHRRKWLLPQRPEGEKSIVCFFLKTRSTSNFTERPHVTSTANIPFLCKHSIVSVF